MVVVENGSQVELTIGSNTVNFNKGWARFWFSGADTIIEDCWTGQQFKAATAAIDNGSGLVGDEAAVRTYLGEFLGTV